MQHQINIKILRRQVVEDLADGWHHKYLSKDRITWRGCSDTSIHKSAIINDATDKYHRIEGILLQMCLLLKVLSTGKCVMEGNKYKA